MAVSTLALAIGAALAPTSLRAQSASPDNPAAASRLSLREALIRAVEADPSLPATRARTLVASAAVRQADVRPNPTLGLMVENLPTLGGGDILGRTETTLSYEQRLERGGDRSARTALARSEGDLMLAEAQVRQLDRLEQVQRVWSEALAAEALLEIARDRLALAEAFQVEVQRRVDAARDPLFAGARAEAELYEWKASQPRRRPVGLPPGTTRPKSRKSVNWFTVSRDFRGPNGSPDPSGAPGP